MPNNQSALTGGEALTFSFTIPVVDNLADATTRLNNVASVLDTKIPNRYELLVVSSAVAGTEMISELCATHQSVRVITASNTAPSSIDWSSAIGDVLVVLDGDFSRPIVSLLDLIKTLEGGSDMAIINQYSDGNNHAGSPIFSCFAIKRHCLPQLNQSSAGYKFLLEVLGPEMLQKISHPGVKPNSETRWGHFISHFGSLLHSQT